MNFIRGTLTHSYSIVAIGSIFVMKERIRRGGVFYKIVGETAEKDITT